MKKAFFTAFPYTMPILTGFLFLGLAYGLYMRQLGFSFWYPMLMSALIFAGSAEFVVGTMLLNPFHPLQTFLVVFLINARHLFYGISMLEKFRGTGRLKPYLIYGLCDETFSINCGVQLPPDVDRKWFMFFVTILNQLYWVAGATLGGLFGYCLTFRLKGLEFMMTSLFIVIFLDYLLKERNWFSAAAGLVLPIFAILIFGKTQFMIPALSLILAVFLIAQSGYQKGETE